MNFNFDCASTNSSHSLQVFPLLVAIREWSKAKEDAFSQTDVILMILQGVQAFSDAQSASNQKAVKVFTAAALKEKLTEINQELSERFDKSLRDVSSDLSAAMNLFDDLSNLFKAADDDSFSPLLDFDCNNSIIGLFVRQCLLTYKTLTFTQLMRYHSRLQQFLSNQDDDHHHGDEKTDHVSAHDQSLLDDPSLKRQNFTSALRELKLWESGSGNRGNGNVKRMSHGNQEIGFEALHLAELHGRFGHKEEAMMALQEAIRLAQQHNNSLLLEFALAWLHRLQHCSDEDTLVILNKFISNAKELKLTTFGGWGKLQQAKTLISLARKPKTVLETILSSDVDFNPVYEDIMENKRKTAAQCSTLAMYTSTWDHYGQRSIALHYAQLLCHMTSCDPLPESLEEKEAFALSLRLLCVNFADVGEYEKAIKILTNAMETLCGTGLPFKILCQCLSELKFDRSIQINDIAAAKRHNNDIITFDQYSAMYRSAVLAKAEGNIVDAVEQVQSLLQQQKNTAEKLQAKCLLLLAELYSSQGLPSHALPHVTECLTLCHKHHLSTLQPNLTLARLQLQLGSPKDATKLVKQCLLDCQINGSAVDRGQAYFLAVQASLLDKKETSKELLKEDVLAVLPLLTQAVNEFKRISANHKLSNALILQVHLYNFIGYTSERDKISTLLVS